MMGIIFNESQTLSQKSSELNLESVILINERSQSVLNNSLIGSLAGGCGWGVKSGKLESV
jgi:hypothetical protein